MSDMPNFLDALVQISEEKSLPYETIVEAVEAALAAAYKKDYGDKDQEVRTELNRSTSGIKVFVSRTVVPDGEVESDFLQISLSDAKKIDKNAKVGTEEEPYMVEQEEFPEDFGRVAAQTAKQVIIQRLREAEREIVFTEYSDKVDQVVNGTVQRVEGNMVYIDLGKAVAVMFGGEQVQGERYYTGQRLKVYIVRVEQTNRGPQVVVSRAHKHMVRHLFELEVPELESGNVEIKEIAREAGVRSKVAVASNAEGVDPVGTFVGGRGARVQAVMSELGEEKIDIVPWSDDPVEFITSALSPAKVAEVELNDSEHRAVVRVPEDQLSLAIGKQGQNVRLAAKLTGWNIDITSADESRVEAAAEAVQEARPAKRSNLEDELIAAVESGTAPENPAEDEPATGDADALSGQPVDDVPSAD
jgi:N utilization substance protein A